MAAVGQEEVSKTRENVLLERVNADILASTGWRVEVVKGKALAGVLGVERLPVMVPAATGGDEAADANGCDRSGGALLDEGADGTTTSAERRVQALASAGLIAPVTFSVPAPPEQTKKVQRFLAKEQGKEFEKYRKEQQKKREKQMKRRKQREAKHAGDPERFEAALQKERREEEDQERRKMEKLIWLVFRQTE